MSEKHIIKPYGDTFNDGMVQLSFTLPVENCARAKKAAEMYARKLNLENISVAHSQKIADNFSYFVVYGKAMPTLDYSSVTASEVNIEKLDFYQINARIKTNLIRKIAVIGASIGTDAHTVGIDAIMNMKGYHMDYGLERYPEIVAFNMGSQVSIEELIKKCMEEKADAILVSQTVTQKDVHIRNLTAFMERLEAENIRKNCLVLAGGPRITNDLAVALGYDAGFGPGTIPSMVASFIASKLIQKKEKNGLEL